MKTPLCLLLLMPLLTFYCASNYKSDIDTIDSLGSSLIRTSDSLLIDSLAIKMLKTDFEENLSLLVKLEILENVSVHHKSILDSFSVLLNRIPRAQWPKNALQVFNIKMRAMNNRNSFINVFALDSSCLNTTIINTDKNHSVTFWITDFYGNRDSFEIDKKGNRYYCSNHCLTDSIKIDSLYIAAQAYQQEYGFKTYCSMENSQESLRIQCGNAIYQIVPLCSYSRFPVTSKIHDLLTVIQNRIVHCKSAL